MQILIVVVARDPLICRAIESLQEQLVPETFRRHNHAAFGGARYKLSCLSGAKGTSHGQLIAHLEERRTDDTQGILIISDRRLGLAAPPLSDVYFINEFDQNGAIGRPDNFVSALLNRALADFRVLTRRFRDGKYQRIFRLPLRNFQAAELDDLRQTCRDSIDVPDFANRLDSVLASFRWRMRPKRKEGRYSERYLVDDVQKHFRLGFERHARAETGPPHTILCLVKNRHRFGRSFDHEQHYNVSLEDNATMIGRFPNCHNQMRSGKKRKHLNMFTSDFF